MLTKVKLRQKPLADGKLSLYLDFYPPIADPVTGKKTRREFLQLHIWEKPKGSLQRQHNADTLFVAEQIRFERENALLKSNIYSDLEKEHIAYLERSEKKFIEYYEESFKDKPLANWYRYSGAFYLLKKFCPKDIKFKDITLKWCENFRNFVLRADSLFHEGKTLAQTTRHNYFRCFRTILLQAFNEGYLRENLNAKLECIPRKDRPRQFLSVSELTQCLFGEHLLPQHPDKTIALVESEKTAIICSAMMPQYLWLATGGKSGLTSERLNSLKGRKIIVFPDIDAFKDWQQKIFTFPHLDIRISRLLEDNATPADRAAHIDLADWLLRFLEENASPTGN